MSYSPRFALNDIDRLLMIVASAPVHFPGFSSQPSLRRVRLSVLNALRALSYTSSVYFGSHIIYWPSSLPIFFATPPVARPWLSQSAANVTDQTVNEPGGNGGNPSPTQSTGYMY
ncbi:hypothetical protein M413DRAFT_438870 [Hebeloma cylindrosporum]|uniref:Uncharacterized protein n=1 Tax=Hebeloma cylindrosporum TaxID=76867 RepID=A0A0C3D0U7_HEBCY|nr:hypothetical protein M413DRAFT_438870 [Hebeloma cylindrosporum h7]